MTDGAVNSLVDFLLKSLHDHAHLIKDAEDQVRELERNQKYLTAKLKDLSPNIHRQNEISKWANQEIRNILHKIEDATDHFEAQICHSKKCTNFFRRWLRGPPGKLLDVAKDFTCLMELLADRQLDAGSETIQRGSSSQLLSALGDGVMLNQFSVFGIMCKRLSLVAAVLDLFYL